METQSGSANLSEDRRKRFTSISKDTSFSLRSPLTKTHKEWEQSSPQKGRYKSRPRGSHRPRNTDDRKPTLAQFAPDLMTRLHPSPPEGASSGRGSAHARDIANRKNRSQAKDASFSLRSPLDRKSETQAKGRGSGGQRQTGSQRSHASSQSSSEKLPKDHKKDTAQQGSTTDSRGTARKCLWAEDVDEAFVDGDNFDDEAFCDDIELDEERADSSEVESPHAPLTEQQLARREKDINYGKVTQGYLNYIQQVPKHMRDKNCPRTPNKMATNYSRRKWDSLVHTWRRHLHQWDDAVDSCADDSISEESTPLKGRLHHTDVDFENRTPSPRKRPLLSSTHSSPSDLGYVTTPDSKANLSYQQLNDDVDSLPPEHDNDQHFPPLVSTGVASTSPAPMPTKGAWTLRREESESKAKAENDSLNEFAQKLTISDGV